MTEDQMMEALRTRFVGAVAVMRPVFPVHADAILMELSSYVLNDEGTYDLVDRRLTETRWNHVADILCSLAALPGESLSIDVRHFRLSLLCLAEAARCAARHCFGGARARGALELALHIAGRAPQATAP